MSKIKLKRTKTPSEKESQELMSQNSFKERSESHKHSTIQPQSPGNKLRELIEENDEEIKEEEEDIQNISFSLSGCEDMNELIDTFSNKSDEKVELEYESTTNDEGLELIQDFLKESVKQILNNKKGFDEDVKKMSDNFYTDLIKNISEKDPKRKFKNYPLDKTKNTNYKTQSESINSDEITNKLKNDLVGQTFENKQSGEVGPSYGKVFSLNSKNKSNNSDSYIKEEEDEEDKIIEIRKKKVKKNENIENNENKDKKSGGES